MKGKIISVTEAAIDISEIVIEIDREIRFLNGQYVMVSFEDKSSQRRAYSILRYDKDPDMNSNKITLLVKASGEFTYKLMHSKPDDIVYVYGPYGKFTLKDNNRNIFIAGGIGIVPLYSMILQAAHKPHSKNHLYYACRRFKEMALYDELSKMHNAHIDVKMYFTREGNMERFNVEELKSIDDYSDYDYYICGPDEMMAHIKTGLKQIGIDDKKIHLESFNLENEE